MPVVTTTLTVDIDGLEPQEIDFLKTGIARLMAELDSGDAVADAVLGWTPTSVLSLYRRLVAANRPIQAYVIRAAGMNGGQCLREEVYSLGGYAKDRSLKGFTRPVARIVKQMQEAGELPIDAADPMKPIYDWENPQFQKAQGFEMPSEIAPLFAELPER